MSTAVCPGSFDPVTNGHLDIVSRAATVYEQVIVAILVNPAKSVVFSVDERIAMLEAAAARLQLGNVAVLSFEGLLVDFCREQDARVIVRGLRAATDFDYELAMAQMNSTLSGVETAFLATSPQWSFLSSSLIKEVVRFGGDVSSLVPPEVADGLQQRLAHRADH